MSSTHKTVNGAVRAYLEARPGVYHEVKAIIVTTGYPTHAVRNALYDLMSRGRAVSNGKRRGAGYMHAVPDPATRSRPLARADANAKPAAPVARPWVAGSGQIAGPREAPPDRPLDPAMLRPIVRAGAGGPAVPGVVIRPSIYDRARP